MIRKFKSDDIDAVITLWPEGNLCAHGFVDAKYWHSKYRAVKSEILSSEVYVYEHEKRICAFVGVREGYVEGLFTAGDLRSLGIGCLLLGELKRHYDRLTLKVYEQNHRAVKFYTREGFSIERMEIDKSTGAKEYVMVWERQKKERNG